MEVLTVKTAIEAVMGHWQSWHRTLIWLISSVMPGQNMINLARLDIMVTPWWAEWRTWRASWRNEEGTRTRSLYRMTPSDSYRPCRYCQNRNVDVSWRYYSGKLSCIAFKRFTIFGSFLVSFWSNSHVINVIDSVSHRMAATITALDTSWLSVLQGSA